MRSWRTEEEQSKLFFCGGIYTGLEQRGFIGDYQHGFVLARSLLKNDCVSFVEVAKMTGEGRQRLLSTCIKLSKLNQQGPSW